MNHITKLIIMRKLTLEYICKYATKPCKISVNACFIRATRQSLWQSFMTFVSQNITGREATELA